MGAGQIGGIATLLDIDFENPAHFLGKPAEVTEGQFIVYYLSHAMMFCVGALIEAHVVVTPAICVYGERYKFDVYGGTHKFVEDTGVSRQVHHLCLHKGYNHTNRLQGKCSPDNLALLVLNQQFSFNVKEHGAEFIVNRLRYGSPGTKEQREEDTSCKYFGWGSRRNGYLVPLLIQLRRMDITILPSDKCLDLWNNKNSYLCIQQPQCKSDKYGALCPIEFRKICSNCSPRPFKSMVDFCENIIAQKETAERARERADLADDVGSVISCSGFAHGMMVSRMVDRPCGVGFIDLTLYNKFLTCGVDDSRDVIDHDEHMALEVAATTVHLFATAATTMH